jgi:hypothetical protein
MLAMLCFFVIPFKMFFEGLPRKVYGDTSFSVGFFRCFIFIFISWITVPFYLLYMYVSQVIVKFNKSDGFDLKQSKIGLMGIWTDIFLYVYKLAQSAIFGVIFFISGLMGIYTLLGQDFYKKQIPSATAQTYAYMSISIIAGVVMAIWAIIQYVIPYNVESCKNGWYNKFDSSYNKIKIMCKIDKIKEIEVKQGKPGKILLHTDKVEKPLQRNETWFTLYPSVTVGAIIPFDLTSSPIFEVLTLLPSPLPLWITMAEPIYVHRISQKIPYLLEKLKVLYSGIQQIITTYNDGSIMINDLIAYVDKTIRTTLIPSPPTVESDMQLREVISLLFNVLNLYLVTHWYYINQSEMTTFLFNIRNNLILLHRSISLESKDLEYLQNEKFIQDINKRVDNILTVVLSFPPTPIILPDNVYESYKPVSSSAFKMSMICCFCCRFISWRYLAISSNFIRLCFPTLVNAIFPSSNNFTK